MTLLLPDMEEFELFELLYYSEEGMRGINSAQLSLLDPLDNPDSGTIFRITWGELESIENQLATSAYLAVKMATTISGVFFSFNEKAPVILNPNLTLERNQNGR